MAATTLSIGSRDVFNRPKRTILRFPSAATLAQIQTYVTGYVVLQRAIQGPTIEVAEVTFSLTVPANDPAETGYNAQNGANFSFANASLNSWGVWLPGIHTDLMVGQKGILTSDADVQAWLAYIITGDTVIAPCNESEQDVGALVSAIQSHRK